MLRLFKEKDKQEHFMVGAAIYSVVYPLSLLFTTYANSVYLGLLAVILAAAGKEIWDSFHQDEHTPEINDLVATLFGGIVIMVINSLIYIAVKQL